MPDTAATQVPRLVELIAWLSQRDSKKPVTYRAAAKHLGVSEATIRQDLNVLVGLSDEHRDWLASLRVGITAEGFAVHSLGAFRRPTHFSGDEGLALLLGLNTVRNGNGLARRFARALKLKPDAERVEASFAVGAAPSAELEDVLAVARRARDDRRKLEIIYCGSAGEPSSRIVHAHQIVEHAGRWYVIAWCEKVAELRHFRADRIVQAELLARDFRPQVLFTPIRDASELLHAEQTIPARVRFSPRIARWLRERYPSGQPTADGGVEVTFRVADTAWFVREMLQYGAEAEVLEPESLREAMRRVVA